MENPLFRKKSLDRISSPEELHDYMRVTSPRLWMILAAIVILLAGFLVYASTATLENTVDIRVSVESFDNDEEDIAAGKPARFSVVTAALPISMADTVKNGMRMRIGKEEGKISWIVSSDEEINVIFEMDHEMLPVPDGEHDAKLVIDSTTPISYLWN